MLGVAAFSFAKIQHDPIPTFTIHWHRITQPVATTATTERNDIIGKAVTIVPASLNSAQAAGPAALSEGPDLLPAHSQGAGSTGGIPVLMYHHVGDLPENPDTIRKDLTVSTANFTVQVQWLKTQGYQSITPDQLYAWLKNGTTLPSKSILFTFDDGYSDVFQNAVPVLEANGMTGSFGIITGYVGTADYATWDQILNAKSQGMQIVSHSYSHPDFSIKSPADQSYDITKSDSDFNAELGAVPAYFIYPYGKYNATTETLLQANQFLMSFTTAFGFVHSGENLLELPRIRVHGAETLQTFKFNLTGQK